ncbi:MAG: type IX secretion system protein PorQ [Bacteroidales bacterium]
MKQNLLKAVCIVAIGLIFSIQLIAQTGGRTTYKFLNLTQSARVAALGGNFVAIHDNDLGLALANPSLITPQMGNSLSLNFTNSFAGTNYGFASYGFNLKKFGSFAGSMQYYSYGKADNTNEFGETNGQFSAGEYAFNLGWGRMLDSVFSIGANVKMIYSSLEIYNSLGMAVDVTGSYVPNESFCASLLFRNIGRQITAYTAEGVEPLPFEIQAGISKKLAHVPFRYSILLQHLEKWDLSYTDPNATVDPFTGEPTPQTDLEKFAGNAMKHIIFGGEFIPAKFLSIRIGYNYLRRQEMKVVSRPGSVGFSWGFGLKVSKFNFNYARAAYHLSGSPNYISISTNLGDWGKK